MAIGFCREQKGGFEGIGAFVVYLLVEFIGGHKLYSSQVCLHPQ